MAQKRMCFYVPVDAYIPDHGFRVSVVTEGVAGHSPTGTWPYEGKVGQQMPYFWGHDYEKAQKQAERQNERMGLTKEDVVAIVGSSIAAQHRRGGIHRERL